MHSIQRAILFFIACLFLGPLAHANLNEAKANYSKVIVVPPGSKFDDSPFNFMYLVRSDGSYTLFDKSLTMFGYLEKWTMREDANKPFVDMNFNQADGVKTLLRQNLKTEWMVRPGYGAGGKRIVVISAPNCPVCKQMEADMAKHSKSIPASVFVVPTLLGRGSEGFRNAVMCSRDPSAMWQRSLQSGTYATSATGCEKSLWAEVVIDNTFSVNKNNQLQIKTPTIILSDGTLVNGWKRDSSLAEIKQKLGL